MWYTMTKEEVARSLRTDIENGLTEAEAKNRIEKYGQNKLEEKNKTSIIIRFLMQFNDFMIIILFIAAGISAVMAYIEGTGEYIDAIFIIAIVVFNACMGLSQESKAEKALEELAKMSAPNAKVKRDGKIKEIPATNIVPGDIIILEQGNFVPADSRLINGFNLKAEESALTGETMPVKKEDIVLKKDIQVGDTINMVFGTTVISYGNGMAIVTDTGMNTKVGKIAKLILEDTAPETPLQRKLGEVGKKLGLVAVGICFAIFIIGILKKLPATEMFMTSVGLAVAAIPEGLPAIVTILLSIGVTKMARKNAIIRRLPAVETLGSSQVICSDKTGTLTQNKMEVVQITSCEQGPELERNNRFILELGCMCNNGIAFNEQGEYQISGEPTEVAIINAGLKYKINKDEMYKIMPKINEIPFESSRKLMTTVHKIGDKYRIITKGAPDVLIKRCSKYHYNGSVYNINDSRIMKIQETNIAMAQKALRVLAVAYKDVSYIPNNMESELIEKDLNFVRTTWYDRSTKRRCKRSGRNMQKSRNKNSYDYR